MTGTRPGGPPRAAVAPSTAFSSDPSLALPVPGLRLCDRYEIVEEIGRGGLSHVFHAIDHGADEAPADVALKVLTVAPDVFDDAVALLAYEAQLLAALPHPAIVSLRGSGVDGRWHFLVLERLVGEPLATMQRRRGAVPLTRAEIGEIARDIGAALVHLHGHGYIHADLKPGNVVLLASGGAKLIDFHTARPLGGTQRSGAADQQRLDRVGALTPEYAALERLRGEPPDVRDDVFSFAAVLYGCLAGRRPYAAASAEEASLDRMSPVRPPGLTAAGWRVLNRALALDRVDRNATIADVVAAIRRKPGPIDLLMELFRRR